MIQFYKMRDFGALVSDTFNFIKKYGKNYFANYILINSLPFILMSSLFFIGYRELFAQLFVGNMEGQSYYFETYFQENQTMLIVVSLLCFVIFMAALLINYCYPVFYMKRLSETRDSDIKASQIMQDIKANMGRILKLFVGSTFIITPIAVVLFSMTYLLLIILIGFFLMILVFPTFVNIVNFLLYDYFHKDRGFFGSLSYAFRAQFSYSNGLYKTPFWKYWGATLVMYIIIQILVWVFSIAPMFILLLSDFSFENGGLQSFSGAEAVLLFVFYVVAILVSLVLYNIIYISSGFQYYDSRTDLHRAEDILEIETIGNAS